MAELIVRTDEILGNIKKLNDLHEKHGIQWTLITKVVSGNKKILNKLLKDPEIKRTHSIGDSRLSNLKAIKEISPDIVTMYIKPTPIRYAPNVVKYADISLNTSFAAIKALNDEAKKLDKIHRIIIMIELGELREGVLRENIIEFYQKVFDLPNIEINGIGTNLGCMYGVEPTYDKLIQLSLYKELLESTFDKKLELISGGSSITLPLIEQGKIPESVNHFRNGEAVFLGLTPLTTERFDDLSTDAFTYRSSIIELEDKKYIPEGQLSEGNVGHAGDNTEYHPTDTSYKAILDFGILDVDTEEIIPLDKDVHFIGTTSDLTVYDLGENKKKNGDTKYKVGDRLEFTPSYMGVARLMNSKFVEKKLL